MPGDEAEPEERVSDAGPTRAVVETGSESETEAVGRRLGELLAAEPNRQGATVVALEGELGAGKTRFVRGLVAGLGGDPSQVASPTFVLAVSHDTGSASIVHVDAWRMRSPDDLASIGWDEALAAPGTVIAVEWASRIAASLPASRVDVAIEHLDLERRRLTITDRRTPSSPKQAGSKRGFRCPTCGRDVVAEATTAPFCSSRCRLADLNRWFRGDYSVSRPVTEEDEEV